MKSFKRMMSFFVIVAMLSVMSVTSFAALEQGAIYAFSVKIENSEGKEITTAQPGDTVYASIYVSNKNHPTESIVLEKSAQNALNTGIIVPADLFAETTEGMEDTPFTGSSSELASVEAKISDSGEGFYVVFADLSVANIACTIDPSKPVVKSAFTVLSTAAETSYDFSFYEDGVGMTDGNTVVVKEFNRTSFNVKKSTPAKTAVLTFEGVEGTKTVDESGKLVGDVPTLADKTEATFDGWAVKGTTEKVDFTTAAFTADTTFEAIWKTRTFTVKFDTDGANETVADQTVEYGKTVTDPGALTKDGYTFGGWDKDIATPITADTTFTAKWTKNHVAAVCGTELSEVKAYTDGFYYEGRYFFTANDDVVANYGVSIKGATSTKDFVGNKKVEGSAKVLYRIALLSNDEAALNAIVATPFINK